MAFNSSIPEATTAYLGKLAEHVEGRHVLYATKFLRPEGKIKGTSTGALARFAIEAALKASSQALASGIPNDGWLIATPSGIHIFKKSLTGAVGAPLGTLTSNVIESVSVAHGKKASKTKITINLVDYSSATVLVRTGETYPALSPWIRGAGSTDDSLADRLPSSPDALSFDTEALLRLPTVPRR